MAEISVIMLTYNREDLVGRAIESVIAQSFKDFEYIIVDNGSSDNSGKIAEEYAEKDGRIKVLHIAKSNIGNGRNEGLNEAVGEYVTFIDDDDTMEPMMLEELLKAAKSADADMSICGSYREVNGTIENNFVYDGLYVMTPEEAVIEMLERRKTNIAMPTKLVRRKLFDNIRFLPEGVHDDITTAYKYPAASNRIVMFGKPLYTFYRHSGNVSGFTGNDKMLNPTILEEYFEAYRDRVEYLSKKLPSIAEYLRYSEYSFLISMCNKIKKNNLLSCKAQYDYAYEKVKSNLIEFTSSEYFKSFEKEYVKYIFGDEQQ